MLPFSKKHRAEALRFLHEQIAHYHAMPYQDLLRLLSNHETVVMTGDSGKEYQIEMEAYWDGKPNGNLRVCGSVDDGWLMATINFKPFLHDFIIRPDGTFVGEEQNRSNNTSDGIRQCERSPEKDEDRD